MNIKPWLQLFRISNLPTVVSNVLVGGALAGVSTDAAEAVPLLLGGMAIILIYLAGMVMNDVIDLSVDHIERPERPLVQGVISRGRAVGFCQAAFIFAAILLMVCSGWALAWGLLLAVSVVIYNILHKQSGLAVLFMGFCRALIYPTVYAAVAGAMMGKTGFIFSISLGIYTVLLTTVARVENTNRVGRLKWLAVCIPISILAASLFVEIDSISMVVIPAALLLGWYIYAGYFVFSVQPRIKQAVCGWLAGFCLVDMFWLGLIGQVQWMPLAGLCFVLTLVSQRRIMGT